MQQSIHLAVSHERAYIRAQELCQLIGSDPHQLFQALWGLWGVYMGRVELQTACKLGEEILSLAQSVQDSALLLEACHALGYNRLFMGEIASAREYFEQAVALYDPQKHQVHTVLYGHDPGVCCLANEAFTFWFLGYPEQASERMQKALGLARELSHPFNLAIVLYFRANFHQYLRETQAVQAEAEAAIETATEHGFPAQLAEGNILRGWALVEEGGGGEEGVGYLRQGLAEIQATGVAMERSHFLALLAEAYGNNRQAEEGLSTLGEALTFAHETGERLFEAELYRLKGELVLQSGVQKSLESEAEECFQNAIEVARKQSAKSWELRAATSLARLWQQQGKKTEACQLLSEIYHWFTEGFDTKDLQEAKALLQELGGRKARKPRERKKGESQGRQPQ